MMIPAVNLTVEIFGGYQGGTEPWEKTTSLRVDESGFHETHFVGYSGDDRTSLDASSVGEALLNEFDGTSLLNLLAHIVRLHAVLRERTSISGGLKSPD